MITYVNGVNTIIHDATAANFSGFCYDTAVVGSAGDGDDFILNGTLLALPAGTMITMKIASVSASTAGDLYLVGTQINNMLGSPNLP